MKFRFRAVVFDMDNTVHDLYAARFAAAGAVMSFCEIEGDLAFFLLNRDSPSLPEDSIREFLGREDSAALWLFHAVERNALRLFDGIAELLGELKAAGVKLAVISNADGKDLALRVGALGLSGIFDVLVSPVSFGVKKPHRDVYLKTLAKLGVSPEEAVMVGDRLDRDVVPPRECGLFAVHAWYGSFEKRDGVCAACDVGELAAVLRGL